VQWKFFEKSRMSENMLRWGFERASKTALENNTVFCTCLEKGDDVHESGNSK
jgi:hypothetical protein